MNDQANSDPQIDCRLDAFRSALVALPDDSLLARTACDAARALTQISGNRQTATEILVQARERFSPDHIPPARFLRLLHQCTNDTVNQDQADWAMTRAVRATDDPKELVRLDILRSGYVCDRGDPASALAIAMAARDRAAGLDDPLLCADAEEPVAHLLVLQGDTNGALHIRKERQLPIYERLHAERQRAKTVFGIAEIVQIRGDADATRRLCESDVLPAARKIGDPIFEAETKNLISVMHLGLGDTETALTLLQDEVLPVMAHQGTLRQNAVVRRGIADVLLEQGETDAALDILEDEVLPVFKHLSDPFETALTRSRVAALFQEQGDSDESMRILMQEVLPVFQGLGYEGFIAMAWRQVADIHQENDDIDDALAIRQHKLLPAYARTGATRETAITMANIAMILYEDGYMNVALNMLENEAFAILRKLGDTRAAAHINGIIAEIRAEIAEIDHADRSGLEAALIEHRNSGDRLDEAFVLYRIALNELGSYHSDPEGSNSEAWEKTHLQDVLAPLNQAYAIASELDAPDIIAESGITLAYVLNKIEDKDKALVILGKAQAAAETLGDKDGVRAANRLRAAIEGRPEDDWDLENDWDESCDGDDEDDM